MSSCCWWERHIQSAHPMHVGFNSTYLPSLISTRVHSPRFGYSRLIVQYFNRDLSFSLGAAGKFPEASYFSLCLELHPWYSHVC